VSLQSDLAGAYAERELTVPVKCGDSVGRGFFNVAGAIVTVGRGASMQTTTNTLFIFTGSLDPDLGVGAQLQVGAVGADAVTEADQVYRVRSADPWNDDLETKIMLDGGRR
jgi:hypothetical protein